MNIESQLNESNRNLLTQLREKLKIRFALDNSLDSMMVGSKHREYTIYFNSRTFDNASIAHELLHIELELSGLMSSNHFYLLALSHEKLNKIFTKHFCDQIGNFMNHQKMFPKFIALGYKPESFVENGCNLQSSINDLTELPNIFYKNVIPGYCISLFIGNQIAIYSDPIKTHDYTQHLKILRESDIRLFETVKEFWKDWTALDTNAEMLFNPELDIMGNFYDNIESWSINKNIL